MTINELRVLNGNDGNEACHAFWDECGEELLDLWDACEKQDLLLPLPVLAKLGFLQNAAQRFT